MLDNAEVIFAAVQDQEQVDKLLSVQERVPKLRHICYDEERGLKDYDHTRLHPLDAVIASGKAALGDKGAATALDADIEAGKGSDVSIILYTSGTTGRSKGVMLSAQGCIDAAVDTVTFDKLTDDDSVLAYCRSPGSATITSTTRRPSSPASASAAPRARRRRRPTSRRSGRPSISPLPASSRTC